eukprot:842378-Amphidinium_carterae.1
MLLGLIRLLLSHVRNNVCCLRQLCVQVRILAELRANPDVDEAFNDSAVLLLAAEVPVVCSMETIGQAKEASLMDLLISCGANTAKPLVDAAVAGQSAAVSALVATLKASVLFGHIFC